MNPGAYIFILIELPTEEGRRIQKLQTNKAKHFQLYIFKTFANVDSKSVSNFEILHSFVLIQHLTGTA